MIEDDGRITRHCCRCCTRIFRDLTYWCSLKCRADTFKDGVVAQARPLSGALQCLRRRGFLFQNKDSFAISYPTPQPLLFIFHRGRVVLRPATVSQKGYVLSLFLSLPFTSREFLNGNCRHDLFLLLGGGDRYLRYISIRILIAAWMKIGWRKDKFQWFYKGIDN